MNATSAPGNAADLELGKERRDQSVCDAGKTSEAVEGDKAETPDLQGMEKAQSDTEKALEWNEGDTDETLEGRDEVHSETKEASESDNGDTEETSARQEGDKAHSIQVCIDPWSCFYCFLARLHFSAEELLLYPRRPCRRRCPRPHTKC